MKILHFLKPIKKKIIIIGVLIILTIIGFFLFGRKKAPDLQFSEVKRQDIKSTISSSGKLTGKEAADLKFRSSGKIAVLKTHTGDKVNQYDLIASLDTKQFEIDLQQARNSLVAKEAAAKKAEDDVKDHDKDESFSQKVTRTTAQTARDNAYDDVKSAQESLNDAYLYSPISGVVTKVPFVTGQNVLSTDLIAEIVNIEEIYFDTEVDESDISSVEIGQNANITLDSYPDKIFKGTVDKIIPQTKITSSGATVINVRIKLENPDLTFVNELSGQSEIITKTSSDVLTIPLEAIREDKSVVVKIGKKFEAIKVTTGITSDADIEITSGLKGDEKILLNPPSPETNLNKFSPS